MFWLWSSAIVQSAQFLDVWNAVIDEEEVQGLCKEYAPVPQTAPKLTAPELVSSLVFHQLQDGGTLAKHAAQLHGVKMTDSAHTQRRELLPVELFEAITASALRPLADEDRHKDCFFEGLRLQVVDGSQFSVLNTPILKKQLPKAASRRLEAAFAKVRLVCAIELGTHAPIAVAVAPASEGEQTLAKRLWVSLPGDSLSVMDRLFGTARTLDEAMTGTQGRNAHFLVRIRENIKVDVLKHLPDGSSLVDVPVKEGSKIIKKLRLREINAAGIGRDGKKFTLRLWTTLLDPKRYPADRLAGEYAERWEGEIFYRELKLDVRSAPVLASHTLETALQELLALVLASAVLAHLRVETSERLDVPARRVSFFKLLLATRQLWATYHLAGATLTAAAKAHIWRQFQEDLRYTAILPERRARTCPRVLRQPVSKWPRKLTQPSHTGKVRIEIVHG
jgi:hypothetical protein